MQKFSQILQRNGMSYLQVPLNLWKHKNVDYVMVHINYRLKVFFKNGRSS